MGFVLPEAPESLAEKRVKAWSAPVVIPTYLPMPPDKNPMFLERRVYQGSSGKVYPLPFIDRISTEKVDRSWQAIHIENDYIRLMILPELGGRIHVGLDKTNGYDFFYRQNVIKPALVGLAGPWISGGVEFNWPQHHRPSTFMPVDTHIEEHADGSVTVWCGEHEPMSRMKGMHGICLKPGSSLIELKVRLYNRTELPQTFLWWANVGVRVHERYQSFFPPDAQYVADHAKRAMSRFPLCEGKYYGVDYAARAKEQQTGSKNDAWDDGAKKTFVPPEGMYAANDLSWYANIRVPTSYMILGTKENFFGGYDHKAQAGFVHIADPHISPGKKQWTWGNHPFGYAWDRNLTDPESPGEPPAPYIELMAGVFTDNQPDFSWLMPGETRAFSQFWYPIPKIGPAQKANNEAALSLTILPVTTEPAASASPADTHTQLRIGIAVTSKLADAQIELRHGGELLFQRSGLELSPAKPLVESTNISAGIPLTELRLTLLAEDGREIIAYQPVSQVKKEMPEAAKEPALPEDVKSVEELYLIGLHLEQYRHATRHPELYWREALKRDPSDSRCNNAMGLFHLRRGEFGKAVTHFQSAIATLTQYNPNPRDGEPYYNLGIALWHTNRIDEARDALSKAKWNHTWSSAAEDALSHLNTRKIPVPFGAGGSHGPFPMALHATQVARDFANDPDPRLAGILKTARDSAKNNSHGDPGIRFLLDGIAPKDVQHCLDVSLDCAKWMCFQDAIKILQTYQISYGPGSPLTDYYLAYLQDHCGEREAAQQARTRAALAPPDYCFPHRLEEIAILLDAITKNPEDARAPYYLGSLLYDKRRHEEAITWWEKSAKLDRSFPTVWRNLGIAYYNVLHDLLAAKGAYQRAFKNGLNEDGAGGDARVLYERDQLWKRAGEPPRRRLDELEQHMDLVDARDDLTLEYCSLLNQVEQHEDALTILNSRHFQPWEGGEGLALAQWVRAHIALGRKALWLAPGDGGSPARALQLFTAGLHPPENLGEAFHLLQNNSELHYWAGMAARALGDAATASQHFATAAASVADFQRMSVCPYSENSLWAAEALRQLRRPEEARKLYEGMLAHAETLKKTPAKIDYFATSLPTMLIFDEDIQKRQTDEAALLEALARWGINGNRGQDKRLARHILTDLLQANPSHAIAADLLIALDWTN